MVATRPQLRGLPAELRGFEWDGIRDLKVCIVTCQMPTRSSKGKFKALLFTCSADVSY
jgi:hypothetical protein